MTTVATRNESDLRTILSIPTTYAVASIVILGHPAKHLTKLSRRPVGSFTTVDSFDGEAFTPR